MNITSSSTPSINGEYYYIRNLQGDIIGLIDKSGTEVVSYTYDTWGKLISIEGSLKDTVGVKNPYRYRGYRYDTETGLYYLQSRYYNPEWGRFINADGLLGASGELLSHNLFSYCMNNPVNMIDPSGNFALPFIFGVLETIGGVIVSVLTSPFVIGAAVVSATGFLIYSVCQYNKSMNYSRNNEAKKEKSVTAKEYGSAKSKGIPTDDHTVVSKVSNKNPNNSRPNSSSDLLNEDGSVKQRRYYDSNGKPDFDIDFNHKGEETHVFPHSHNWDWGQSPPRLKWEPWIPNK